MDGTVTRSNEGTHDEPKFSLKTLSLKFDFPKIKKLLRDCASKYYGYIPINIVIIHVYIMIIIFLVLAPNIVKKWNVLGAAGTTDVLLE